MQMEKLTVKAQEALARAQEFAQKNSHPTLGPVHLLKALLDDDAGIAVAVLKKIGAPVDRIKDITDSELDRLPSATGGQVVGDPQLQEVLNHAQDEADQIGRAHV